jgi:phage-related protein (TIGR01555 family)
MFMVDSLVNWLSGLGTPKDKRTHAQFAYTPLGQGQLNTAYRGDWIARKCIDIPAKDMTREWRDWQASPDDIGAIENVEKAVKLQLRTRQAIQKARLFGGGALIIGLDDSAGPYNEPLDVENVRQGALQFVHAVSRYELTAGDLISDLADPNYGEPEYYTRRGVTPNVQGDNNEIQIHHSRIVRFLGNEVLDPALRDVQGWSDSILETLNDAVRGASATISNVAGLVEEAKFDIIKMPEMMRNFNTKEYEERLTRRFQYSNNAKSIINAMLLDKEEEWSRVETNFAGLPDIVKLYLLIACGAVDIPATRFLQQSPTGMNATGDSDTRNYYDMLSSEQKTTVQPALSPLDEVIIRSATGMRDDAIFYLWNPLWQLDDVQKATMVKTYTDVFVADNAAGLINPDALREARINQLIEQGVYPGLEQALDEFGDEPPMDENPINPITGLPIDPTKPVAQTTPPLPANQNEADLFAAQKKRMNDALNPRLFGKPKLAPKGYRDRKKALERKMAKDAAPRSLYMYRPVLNGKDIVAHYKAQGVANLHAPSDLHVTIAYSREPVDWMKIGSDDWGGNADGGLNIKAGGARMMEQLGGDKVVCLLFASNDLLYRHMRTIDAGATWDWDEYQPHITIADAPANPIDLDGIEPWQGPIDLGPEVFQVIDDDWKAVLQNDGIV